MYKAIDETNLNVVVKVTLNEENKEFENSIITAFPLTDKKLKNKLMKLENLLIGNKANEQYKSIKSKSNQKINKVNILNDLRPLLEKCKL